MLRKLSTAQHMIAMRAIRCMCAIESHVIILVPPATRSQGETSAINADSATILVVSTIAATYPVIPG